MERTLFSFIWKFSKRDQFMLLGLTVVTFPFLYASLELPKRIINDAIGTDLETVSLMGSELTQIQFLLLLCFGYLGAVTAHGLLKMRLNTMKGVVAERLLRRFRFTLLSRMLRFPRAYFRTTSQGELVSMVTSEAEPMGGLMGDALAQPVFQAGQMLIILIFLFLQSFWFGLAGIALIPLQAWLIPILQRQINLLNKARIKEIRSFASEIGESAAGISDLRTNGGVRYRLAIFTDRLGKLFEIRFRIYQKKFFMKFINNFITQLTPFFFYSVGGYLAIKGEITVGALVAALGAYKDLSSPWKELLFYYNQTQDMALRWEIVTEKFAPRNMVDERLFEGEPESVPHLKGDIVLSDVTVRNADGNAVLEDIDLTIPAGGHVAIQVASQAERLALAEILTRELIPSRGTVEVAGYDIETLHQAVISARIGYAHSRPYFFDGTLGDNLLMPLRNKPNVAPEKTKTLKEAIKTGNSPDGLTTEWVDPSIAELNDANEIRAWWFDLIKAMGVDDYMVRRVLNSRINPEAHPDLAEAIVNLREEMFARLKKRGLDSFVYQFDPEEFNPAIPLGGNLMFAAPNRFISLEGLAAEKLFLATILEHGIVEQAIGISQTLVEELHQTFGMDGTQHPLFTSLGIEEELYERLVDIATRRRERGDEALNEEEFALLLTVPFAFTAEQIGPAFPESFKNEIVEIRKRHGVSIREQSGGLFVPISPDNYLPRLTIVENALYGRVSMLAGNEADLIEDVLVELLVEHDLRRIVAETIFDTPTGLGGVNLPTYFQERSAFSRAGIKKPDILILDKALASHDAAMRRETRQALRNLLPEATLIFLEDKFENPGLYDLFVNIEGGRIDGVQRVDDEEDEDGAADLQRKIRAISKSELFKQLDARNQRLLAFAAQWYKADAGQRVFSMGDKPDAAYLCVSGQGVLSYSDDDDNDYHVATAEPGRLLGDLAIILNEPRQLHFSAATDAVFLRIGAKEFRSVVESDSGVLLSLLKTVSGHLTGAAELLRQAEVRVPERIGPVQPPAE